jgi:hypothetical protein
MGQDEAASGAAARFFDEASRELGWARSVTQRVRPGSMLTTFDIVGAEPELARRLELWDRRKLRIKYADLLGTTYQFRWASGYGNGADIRIQGVLAPK